MNEADHVSDSSKTLPNPGLGRKVIFIGAVLACCSGFISPPIALACGLVLALSIGNPYTKSSQKVVKYLLQASVVGLGFGINLNTVLHVGQQGVTFTIISIFGTIILGYLIGRRLNIQNKLIHLIASGTAICGGSAIAAVSPVVRANEHETSIALGTVFVLNSIALFIFPPLGHLLNLSQTQFGFWAGIAIHDTSSVVGAAAKYGQVALQTATTVKLTRAMWIVPVTLFTALLFKGKSKKLAIPYFILFFLLASILQTYIKPVAEISHYIVSLAQIGLTVTLFLIGAGLSKAMIRTVGIKPMLLGIMLWIIISVSSLYAVLHFVV
jgi:uncharacterized integral membrane protein (TIGR00698 family)